MNLFHIPLYVKAATPEALLREMIQNNVNNQITYKYFNVVFDGKEWFAWYHGDATSLVKTQLAETFSNPSVKTNGRIKKNGTGQGI